MAMPTTTAKAMTIATAMAAPTASTTAIAIATAIAMTTAQATATATRANLGKLNSNIAASGLKIEDLTASVAIGQAELKNAATIRETDRQTDRQTEADDFAARETELMDAIDTLDRAVGILSKEMANNPPSFAQLDTKNAAGAVKALSAIVDAASFPGQDQNKLMALA